LLYDSDDSPSTYDHSPSIDHRFNKLETEMKDIGKATNDKLRSLGDKLSMEIKVLATTIDARFERFDARFEIFDARTQSKFDALRMELKDRETQLKMELKDRETRFWARVVFTVSRLLCTCYILPSNNAKVVAVAGLTSSAAFLQFQNRAIKTPTTQTPAVQTPAVQAPTVGQK
jgi:hypothetical protein